LGGLEPTGRALFEQSVRTKVQAELHANLPEPLDLVVRVRGADPFSDQPDSSSLRLRVVAEGGAGFTSEIQGSQIKDLPPSLYNHGQRILAWQAVIEGTKSEEGRIVAARISGLEDWQRVERLEADIVIRSGEITPLPESLEISLCKSGYSLGEPVLRVFLGGNTSEEAPPPGGASVAAYRDPSSVAGRMADVEKAAVQDRLWLILAGSLGAGGLLLTAGLGLLFLGGNPGVAQVETIEVAGPTERARPLTRTDAWPPPWVWLVLQAAVLLAVQGHLDYFRLLPEGTELGQRAFVLSEDGYLGHYLNAESGLAPKFLFHDLASEVSWESFVKSLRRIRTFVFPLLINGIGRLTPSLAAWPFCELALRVLAVFVFYLGLRSLRVSGWLALAVSSILLYSTFRWSADSRHTILIDPMAECFAVLTVGMLLVVVGRPRSVLAWSGLTLSLFLTYQGRPAFTFLVGLVPLLGVLLAGLFWDRAQWLGRRLQLGFGLVAASVLPYLGWCTLRWVLVGHFGLVSFGGCAFIYVPGLWLTEEVIPNLPEDLQPLARAFLQERNQLPDWQSPLDDDGWFLPEIVGDESIFASVTQSKSGDLFFAKAVELYGDDLIVVNRKLSEMAIALIKARPSYYAKWLVTATKLGIKRMVTSNPLLTYLALLLGVLMVIWHILYVVHRLRAGPVRGPTAPKPADNYSLELNALVLVAVGFALSSLLLVILVQQPETRYMLPAGIFLPTLLVVLFFAFGSQVRVLLPAATRMTGSQAMSPQGIQREALDSPTPGAEKLGPAWKQSLLLGLLVGFLYSANGREIPSGDTVPSRLLPVALIRGDGPFLDRFHTVLSGQAPDEPLPSYLMRERGHLVSTYPLGTALLAVPFYLPQVLLLDRLRPEWEKQKVLYYTSRMAKNTAAALGALTAVAIFQLLRRLRLGRLAWPAALATAMASNLWADSQTLGHQVAAALALTLSILLLVPAPVSRWRLGLAGLTTGALVWIHPQDLLLAAVIVLWVAWYQPRDLRWFVPLPLLLGGALVGYHYWLFGALAGGSGHPPGSEHFSLRLAPLVEGVAGHLWSPRRSLFVYCPWIALALATVPTVVRRLRQWSIVSWLLLALVPYLLLCSLNSDWWGGHYFGPRSFTDVLPLFAILLGFGLAWSWTRCRPVFAAFGLSLAFATGVQLLGAFYYPSTWEWSPVDIDAANSERAWDWHDNEFGRLLAEGTSNLKGWEWWLEGIASTPQAREVYRPGTRIDCTQASSHVYLHGVWYGPESEWRWSGRQAAIIFRLERVQPLRLRMVARTYGSQRIVIRFNGREVKTLQGNAKALELLEIDLPPDAITERNTLELTLPDAKSPKSVGEGEDARILGAGVAWVEFIPLSQLVHHPGIRIDFTQAASGVYLSDGWHGPEDWGQWSGRVAGVKFRLERPRPLRLRMLATTFGKQRIVVSFNGREVKTLQGRGEAQELFEVDLPPEAVAERNTLQLTLPDAKAPKSVGQGEDDRILGVGVTWMEFEPLSGMK
jgi:hypothetical protein